VLAEDQDELIRERAANALLSQPPESIVTALQGDAPAPQLFRYCGLHLIEKPEIAAALIKHWRCPQELLVRAAKCVPSSAVQELLDELDRLSASPLLIAALGHAASLTVDQRQQIEELISANLENDAAVAAAVAAAAALNQADKAQRISLIQRLSRMRVVERVQMAIKGNREERMALIHDPCKVVQRAVLQSQRLSDSEVEGFAAMANLNEEVLRLISLNRKFRKNYTIVRNLMMNPKTPLDVTLHMLSSVTATDLHALTLSKNIPDVLRSSALRLERQRKMARSGDDR
jgi:hypothetical protein